MKKIGITGGVGAGKTCVLDYIRQHYRCQIYLADNVAAALMEPGGACYTGLLALLGQKIVASDGCIDRKAMAECVFGNSRLLEEVNQIVHPAVRAFLEERIREAEEEGKTELFFIEAALLIEAGYKELLDELWYVYADVETRTKRLEEGREYSRDKICNIMVHQLREEDFRKECDFVIDNSGTLEETYGQIRRRLEAGTWQERE